MNIETLVIAAIVAGVIILHLKTRHLPIHEPVCDSSVRCRETKAPQILVAIVAILWVAAQLAQVLP